jgi:hypothetical protein
MNDNIKKYLDKHCVRKTEKYTEFDNIKSAVIGSLDGTTTVVGLMDFYRNGLNVKEYYSKYKNTKEFREVPMFNFKT